MKYKAIVLIAILVLFFLTAVASVASAKDIQERGRYIYDDADRLTLESELGLSSYLCKQDVKSGYETILIFPVEKMTVEQMGVWFDQHGVGKKDIDNGLAIFIFPDNTAYGMIGKGHDRIATPILTTAGAEALNELDDDPVLAILNLLTILGEHIDQPTTYERAGNFIFDNFTEILLWALVIALLIFYCALIDGFQWHDVKIPLAFIVIVTITLLALGAISAASNDIVREYGIINSTNPGHYIITETHAVSDGKITTYYTDTHNIYTNDIVIISYDFRQYTYRYETRDFKGAWNHKIGEYNQIGVNAKNHGLYWANNFRDYSGGLTNRYGTWIMH